MDKKNIELLVTGVGVIILIFLIANYAAESKSEKAVSKTVSLPALESAMPSFAGNGQLDESDERWGRDPFLPDSTNLKEQSPEDMALNGIVADKANPYAIINNDIFKIGDKVNGMTVIEINEKNVVLDENGQRHILELNVY